MTTSWRLRLGRLYADLGQADKALPLLMPALDGLEPAVLLELAPGARSLPPEEGVRVWRRLLVVPILYLAACVWENVLVADPSTTRLIIR